jgi:cytochrome c peroxidase
VSFKGVPLKTRGKISVALTVTGLALGLSFLPSPELQPTGPKIPAEAHMANAGHLQNAYASWRATQERSGGDHNLAIALGWSRGLSTEATSATGLARIDQGSGSARVEVEGLDAARSWDVWLVQNVEGPGRSALPERGDLMHRLGRLNQDGKRATLNASFDPQLFADFHIDVVAVTRAGVRPDQGAILYGSPMLFQRLYAREKEKPRQAPLARVASLLSLGPQPAFADTVFNSMDPLIAKGAQIFFNEKFGGNGRVCATCHPAENNFTIDPTFIASLPANSPLFVGENDPNLGRRFEKYKLLRQLGLVVENADGFEDLDHKYVLRAVPHLLGLSRYLKAGNQSNPPTQRTGWGGDGAPGSGTLREFASGAVLQHLTKSIQRRPGVDFRMPTDAELDALEAFQLALGRQDNPDLSKTHLKDPFAALGLQQFNGDNSHCSVCHLNAGANAAVDETNRNFDIGVGRLPNHPANLIDPGKLRPDGGFGRDSVSDPNTGDFLGFGLNGEVRFNSQPAIEAVDTGPFFHNNAVQTVEESVGFYNSDAFNSSFAGGLIPIHMETTEVENIAAFLRVMNALENIRSSSELDQGAIDEGDRGVSHRLAFLASRDTNDAIRVLDERRLHPTAVLKLKLAYLKEQDATGVQQKPARDALLQAVIKLKQQARAEMIDE